MVIDNYFECVNTNSPPIRGYTCGQVEDFKSCIVDYAASHCDYATEWLFSHIMDRTIIRLYTLCASKPTVYDSGRGRVLEIEIETNKPSFKSEMIPTSVS
ncbi:hypothetical protein PoB_006893300 [Plakobranchus ocellatus]|uniref:Uncharacterized protein n=1 Tax=Plakobranchus ocellatus TaxID=259542 RepID=A0AAV4DEF6_9GAST|nr:hypothetical protein PoB_006893300 [Plakobranchus ocellatus]